MNHYQSIWEYFTANNLRNISDLNTHELEIEDCTVVYTRSKGHHGGGGCVFSMRGGGFGDGGYTITFRNINVEDPRPTKQIFKILMEGM